MNLSAKKLGLALAALVLVLVVVSVVVVVGSDADRDDAGQIHDAGKLSVFELRDGDCINNLNVDLTLIVDAVPCTERHDGEVYTIIELPKGPYPGNDVVQSKAERGCPARLRRLFPRENTKPNTEIFYFIPTKRTWGEDDRTVTCLASFKKPRRGALKRQS